MTDCSYFYYCKLLLRHKGWVGQAMGRTVKFKCSNIIELRLTFNIVITYIRTSSRKKKKKIFFFSHDK